MGELTVAGQTFPFTCSGYCRAVDGGVGITIATYESFDLAGARTAMLNVRTADGVALASDLEVPLSELKHDSQHDSFQVNCWKTGQASGS